MSWTAPREMAKEKLFHQLWYENEKNQLEINEQQRILQLDKDNINQLKIDHLENLENHCETLKEIKEANNDEINRKMYMRLMRN